MFFKRNKSVYLALLALFLLIIIPASFAADNGTEMLSYETANATQTLSVSLEEDALGAGEIYFDASAETDGDGSVNSPYKYLRASRIQSNCNLHFANGQYQLDTYKSIDQVNIMGSDVDKTIIKYDGVAFKVNDKKQFTVKNITFIGASITNCGKFNATNTVFEDGYGSKPDTYGNNYGGAIFTDDGYSNAYVNVDNCTFKNNYAIYGGAIFMGSGNLNVYNSLFFDNCAYNYGGAIACEYIPNVIISNSRFYNSKSIADAGGSIYIKTSKLNADHIDIVNSSSTFGGAITTLNTTVSLSYVNMTDNSAKYDGGAVFHMYGNFTLISSAFSNNSAQNGGALFIDNSTSVFVMQNSFTNNKATGTGGAIYSLSNHLGSPYALQNRYVSNKAAYKNDYFDTSSINLTVGSGNYTMYKANITPIDSLPKRYSLVDDGHITVIKDQQTSGNCWAFTANAVLESCISKANGGLLDLSEENMKNIIALYSDYGWNRLDTNDGGYDNMPWGYLASWLGPVDELDDLFDDRSTLSPVINSVMHVQNIKFFERSSYTDNDEIKRAILNYGAVAAGIYQDSYYLNSATSAYYCWYNTYCNHAVAIVGWDDGYSKSNFKFGGSSDIGDGAWIVRNSWGSSWGDNGYYYVSYYDRNFAKPGDENSAYTIILNDTIRFDKNYQYDLAGYTDYFLNSSSRVWYKNVFTAGSDEYLAAVSTYFEKVCDWTASVLVNGELKDVISGTANPGYYTFNLNKYVPLKKGDVFEAVFNITMAGEARFPVSEIVYLNKLVYGPKSSYVSYDGVNWQDLYNLTWAYSSHTYKSQTACIKAFTYLNPIKTFTDLSIEFMDGMPLNISAIVTDEFGNMVKYGNVTFNINGAYQIVGVAGGRASVSRDLIREGYSIDVSFEGDGYASSSNSTFYTIPKISAEISLELNQHFNNINLTVTVSKLINETVSVDINGNRTFVELINGSKTLILENLSNGRYDLNISLLDDSDYEATPLIDNFIINLSKTSIAAFDLTANDEKSIVYNVTLMDEAKNPIPDKELLFTLNNNTYTNKTDEKGQAILVVNLNKGVYDVKIAFEGDNSYFKSNAESTIKVKGKVWIDLDVATYKNIAFINVKALNRFNETFTLLINDKPNYMDSKNGFAHLQLNDLPAGVYNITVLLDDNEYDFNEAASQFTIGKDESIEIKSSIFMSEDDLIIAIEIANATGNAAVLVDDNYDAVKLDNGKANYSVENIMPGNHSIIILYDDEYLGETFKYEIFNVAKRQSAVELIVADTKVGRKSPITVNVTPGAAGLVSVDINGTQYLVNLSKTNVLEVIFDNAGKYTIVATYMGDDYYKESVSDAKVLAVVEKSPANIKAELPEDIKVGDEFEIKITSDSDAELTVMINGNKMAAYSRSPLSMSLDSILKSANSYKYVTDKAGIYNLTVFAGESDDFASESYSRSFYVAKKDARLDIAPIANVNVGDTVIINVENETDGALIIKVNGEIATGEYKVINAGSYSITAESAATDNYNSGFATYTFNVDDVPSQPKQHVEIAVDVLSNVQAGANTCVNVSIPGATGSVTVIVDGKESTVVLEKGTASLPIENIASGNHSVVVIYNGDDNHDGAYNSKTFNVAEEPIEPQTNVTVIVDGKEYNTEIVNGTVSVTTDPVEPETNVTVIVDGKEYNAEIVNGTVRVATDPVVPETSVTVIVDGKEYSAEIVNGTVRVATDSIGPVANVTVIVDGKEYSAEIVNGTVSVTTDSVGPVANVTVIVDGVEYPVEIVNGTAVVDTGKSEADNNITVVVDGVSYPSEVVNGTAVVTTDSLPEPVIKKDTVIVVDAKFTRVATDYNAGERGAFFYAVLKDSEGNVLVNRTVQIAVNGPIYNVTTDDQGRAGLMVNLAQANIYTYALSFRGDDEYNAASLASSKLTVTLKKTSLTAKNPSFRKTAKTKTVTAVLKVSANPYDGKTYLKAGKKLTLKVGGKTYTASANAKGVVKFNIKLTKKGKYAAKVIFAGDKTYEASSKSLKITVK